MAGMGTKGTPRPEAVIASPSDIVLRGLSHLMREVDDVDVTGTATDEAALFQLLRQQPPNLLVVDSGMIGVARERLDASRLRARLLVFGPQRHVGTCARFDGQIACGYFHLGDAPGRIASSIVAAARCGLKQAGHASCLGCPLQKTLQPPRLPLTRREYDVFVRIGWMQGNTEISSGLGISVKTVESYRESIKRKLGLPSAAALLEAALSWRSGGFVARTDPGAAAAEVDEGGCADRGRTPSSRLLMSSPSRKECSISEQGRGGFAVGNC